MTRIIQIVLFFGLLLTSINGRTQDSLVLYTQTGCSNCAYATTTLMKNHIKYHEYNVGNATHAKAMLNVLKERNYNGTILMPVIIYKNRLLFPASQTEDSLVRVSLHEVVQKLSSLKNLKDTQERTFLPDQSITSGNCEFSEKLQDSVYYLISGNFASEADALHFIKVMNREGYNNAFVKEWQNLYRVVVAESATKDSLINQYKKVVQHYKGAYILAVKDKE